MRVIVILMIIGDLTMDESPLEEEDIMKRSGRPPDRGNNHHRGYSRRGGPPDNGEPPDDEGPLEEDPLGMEEIQDALEDKDHQVHQDLLDQ